MDVVVQENDFQHVGLEREDHVTAKGSLAGICILIEAVVSFIPYPADFRSEHEVRVMAIVHTDRVVVQIVVRVASESVAACTEAFTTVVEPLKALSQGDAIVELVNQVVNVTERVSVSSTRYVSREQYVGLIDVRQLFGQASGQNQAVHSASLTRIGAIAETSESGRVNNRQIVAENSLETAQVRITVIVESTVPTHDVSAIQLRVVVDVVGSQSTGVGEGFCVVERELTAIEEVTGRTDNFVPDDREETTDLHAQVTGRDFAVNLWQCVPVSTTVVPRFIEAAGGSERLGVGSIGTVNVVDTSTESEAFASVGNLLSEEPLLAQLNSAVVGIEAEWVLMGMIPNAGPPAHIQSSDPAWEQFPGLADAAISEETATKTTSARRVIATAQSVAAGFAIANRSHIACWRVIAASGRGNRCWCTGLSSIASRGNRSWSLCGSSIFVVAVVRSWVIARSSSVALTEGRSP